MKIALCGAGSTGKTTLALAIIEDPEIKKIGMKTLDVDARSMIGSMGHKCIDSMSVQERRTFEINYIEKKIQIEHNQNNYITQRSFADPASYWVVRDAAGESDDFKAPIVERCKNLSKVYDLHIFLPFGLIPYENDGWRSSDVSQFYAVSNQIEHFLKVWNIDYLRIETGNFTERVRIVKKYILDKYAEEHDG